MKLDLPFNGLHCVISGGQTGADQAGLICAELFNIRTGGHAPKGWRTLDGPAPFLGEIFGLTEDSSFNYQPRTKKNVLNSDGTVRLASNFNSAGERLTLRYCKVLEKPNISILLDGNEYDQKAKALVEFIINHSIGCLNVAGNADRDSNPGFHFNQATLILQKTFLLLKEQNLIIQTHDTSCSDRGS